MKSISSSSLLIVVSLFLIANPPQGLAMEQGSETHAFTPKLDPGEYSWHPEISPAGPVSIVISLTDQLLYVYRNGVRIGRSTISSGKDGFETPTGFFTILEKDVVHHSTQYQEASMPFMERLTWDGVAIHGGNTPGFPESHGCVHVPMEFAQKLYQITDTGTTVLVTKAFAPDTEPGILFPAQETKKPTDSTPSLPPVNPGPTNFTWKPESAKPGPVSIVFSTLNKQVCVYRNGIEIGRANVDVKGKPLRSMGNHVYIALNDKTPDGHHKWKTLGALDSTDAPDMDQLKKVMVVPTDFSNHLRDTITPGTTLLITNQGVDINTKAASKSILDSTGPDSK